MKSFKTQLRPTAQQKETFRHWAKVRAGVYNWGRSMREYKWEKDNETLSHYDLDGMVTKKKTHSGFEHWGNPPRRVLWYALRDMSRAFEHFFRRLENGKAPGYPRRAHPSDHRFTVYGSDVSIQDGAIRLPKIGWIRLEEKGYLPPEEDVEKLSEVTVLEKADRWYVSVQAHVNTPIDSSRLRPENKRPEYLAVHPGVRVWLALRYSDGAEERWTLPLDRIAQLESRIDRQHRTLSRRQNGSSGWKDARRNLTETYRKKRNLLDDNLHKATAKICYDIRPKTLIVQEWDVGQMMEADFEHLPRKVNRRINRRMASRLLGRCLEQLQYKAEWAGVDIHENPPDLPVSKRCANCGYVNEDLRGQKYLECSGCGQTAERETNALDNYILEFGHDKITQG